MDKKHKEENATLDALIAFYNAQWNDIHHSRMQDWELIKLIVLGLIGASGFKVFEVSGTSGLSSQLFKFFAVGFFGLSLLGVFVTARHRLLFKEKMHVIVKLETILKVEGFFEHNSGGKTIRLFRKIFIVQHALVSLYMFMASLFVYFINPRIAIISLYLLPLIWLFYIFIVECISLDSQKLH